MNNEYKGIYVQMPGFSENQVKTMVHALELIAEFNASPVLHTKKETAEMAAHALEKAGLSVTTHFFREFKKALK